MNHDLQVILVMVCTALLTASVSIAGIITVARTSMHGIQQQTWVIKRDARALALKEFCLHIATWMHAPTSSNWTNMASAFWAGRLWLNSNQASELKALIGAYDPKLAHPKTGAEYETAEDMFAILTQDII